MGGGGRKINIDKLDENRNERNQALETIRVRPNVDSVLGKHIMAQKEEISEVLDCGTNNRLIWRKRNPIVN